MNEKEVYDVVVVGGGSAGVAAAISAAREGAKTLLLERYACFGGNGTLGGVTSFCGFYTRGEKPKRTVGGIGYSIVQMLEKYGCDITPKISKFTGNVSIPFAPEILKFIYDKLLVESSVDFRLYGRCINGVIENNQIKYIQVCDDTKVYDVYGKVFIDATGDANLFHLVGAGTVWGDENKEVQQVSLSFKIMNLPRRLISPEEMNEAILKGIQNGYGPMTKTKGLLIKMEDANWGFCTIPSYNLKSLKCEDMTKAEITLRQEMWAYYKSFKTFIKDMEHIEIDFSGPFLGKRETRRMVGKTILKGTDILAATKTEDSIARASWSPEIHKFLNGAKYIHIPDYEYASVPIGTLQAKEVVNLLGAGRLISCDSIGFSSIRVMATCFATGEAAGILAALQAQNGNYDIKQVQKKILNYGGLI